MVRSYDGAIDLLAAAAALLVLAIMLGIGADVAGRFLLGRPIGWVFEFTEHALLLILFLGMPRLVRENGHVAVDLIVDAVPSGSARILRVTSSLIAAFSSGVIAAYAAHAATADFRAGTETFGIYPLQRFWLTALVSGGLALTSIEFLRLAVREGRGRSPTQPSPAM